MSEELSATGLSMSPVELQDEPPSSEAVPEMSLRTDAWQPPDFLRQAVQDISNLRQQATMVIEKMSNNPASAGQPNQDKPSSNNPSNLNSPAALPPPAQSLTDAALDFTRRWEGPISQNPRDASTQSSPALTTSLGAQPSLGKWIKELSSMANVVVGRCAR